MGDFPTEHPVKESLLNHVGYVVCVGAWVAWVTFLPGLRGSNIFAWVKFFFAWVFAWVKTFYVGPKILRGSIFFALVNFYLLDKIILLYYN